MDMDGIGTFALFLSSAALIARRVGTNRKERRP